LEQDDNANPRPTHFGSYRTTRGGKAVLIDKISESMVSQIDPDILMAGVKQAQKRLAEIDTGAVQTIPGDIALTQIRQLANQ
jgi:Putative addiction module component